MITLTNATKWVLIAGMLLLLVACAGQQETMEPPEPAPDTTVTVEPEPTVTVQVQQENLRSMPNGPKIGETTGGTEYVMQVRRGNWVRVAMDNEDGGAWIWAPSVGFPQVNPMSVPLWIGGTTPQTVDNLTETFGQPEYVEQLGGGVFIYRYRNRVLEQKYTLFGTDQFDTAFAWVDRETRQVLRVEFKLMPYSGTAKELLPLAGLQDVRSTKTNFTHALYVDKFPGLKKVELQFVPGNFNQVELLAAERYPEDTFESVLTTGEKKLVHDEGELRLSMEVTNNSGDFAIAAPAVKVLLMEGSMTLGEWTLGPLNVRIEPGETETIYEPVPIGEEEVDVMTIAASAEIISAMTVPASAASQP